MSLNKVHAGQKLQVAADAWNAMVEAAQDHQARLHHQGGLVTPERPEFGVVLVKNTTGEDCFQFEVLGIDPAQVVLDPQANEREFRQRIVLAGVTPKEEHKDCFCVLQEPIRAGKLGRALLVGLTVCRVDIRSESDTHAEPQAETITHLVSTTRGIARILWKQSGTGIKLAILRISGGAAAEGVPITCSTDIPDHALAEITAYDDQTGVYTVRRPTANALTPAKLLRVPKAVAANQTGTGYLDWHLVKVACDTAPAVGDVLGSKKDSWLASRAYGGTLEVIATLPDNVAVARLTVPIANWVGIIQTHDISAETAVVARATGDPCGPARSLAAIPNSNVSGIWCPGLAVMNGARCIVRPTGLLARPLIADYFSVNTWANG